MVQIRRYSTLDPPGTGVLALNPHKPRSPCVPTGSSRSHCVLYLHIQRTFSAADVRHSKLCLVDLAGSERQDKARSYPTSLISNPLKNRDRNKGFSFRSTPLVFTPLGV